MDSCYLPSKTTQILDARIQPCHRTKHNAHLLSFCLQGNSKCNPFLVFLRTINIMSQAKAAWESLIDASSGDSAIIEVQNW